MRTVAVIPARGGSKGVVDKNLRFVGDRSLLARAVTAAAGSPQVTHVLVSTDEPRIAEEAQRWGAEVVERPADLAGDEASSESVLLHALESAPEAEILLFVQCTSPFTRADDLDRVLAPVTTGSADVSFTVAGFHGFVWRRDGEGAVGVNHDPGERLRRQDRPAELLETGAAYAMRVDGFREAGHRFFGRIEPVELDTRRSLEVDTPADLELARALAPLLDGEVPLPRLPIPRLVALDFDGVFTDNRVLVDQEGREAVWCHRGDGHGLSRLRQRVPVVVLSTEVNPVVTARCEKLGIPCEQDLGDHKVDALRATADRHGVTLDEVLYVGNDVNDLECLRAAGTAVAVADAVPAVRRVAHAVLSRRGGDGALRELADALCAAIDGEVST
jgi:YrbI family 3-deoxy-D-manno-octulosonate 8-phosphate phosphatase